MTEASCHFQATTFDDPSWLGEGQAQWHRTRSGLRHLNHQLEGLPCGRQLQLSGARRFLARSCRGASHPQCSLYNQKWHTPVDDQRIEVAPSYKTTAEDLILSAGCDRSRPEFGLSRCTNG